MAQLTVGDENGWITADVATSGPTLGEALNHPLAAAVVRCALLMAVCALAEGGGWPEDALQWMCAFMERMSQEIRSTQLM